LENFNKVLMFSFSSGRMTLEFLEAALPGWLVFFVVTEFP
jgi:hypothetical protein